MKWKYKGTLSLEVILVVIGMLFLTSVAIIGAPKVIDAAKESRVMTDTASLGSLITQYNYEIGSYPTTLSDLETVKGAYGPWIAELPKDPFNANNDYHYDTDGKKFVINSTGKNRVSESTVNGIQGDDFGFVGK